MRGLRSGLSWELSESIGSGLNDPSLARHLTKHGRFPGGKIERLCRQRNSAQMTLNRLVHIVPQFRGGLKMFRECQIFELSLQLRNDLQNRAVRKVLQNLAEKGDVAIGERIGGQIDDPEIHVQRVASLPISRDQRLYRITGNVISAEPPEFRANNEVAASQVNEVRPPTESGHPFGARRNVVLDDEGIVRA